MLAYRVNRHNMKSIRIRNGGEDVPIQDHTTYFVSGSTQSGIVVTESEFYEMYQITTRLSRKEGRYVVEEKNDTGHSNKGQQ